jgi:hypothetical protein
MTRVLDKLNKKLSKMAQNFSTYTHVFTVVGIFVIFVLPSSVIVLEILTNTIYYIHQIGLPDGKINATKGC